MNSDGGKKHDDMKDQRPIYIRTPQEIRRAGEKRSLKELQAALKVGKEKPKLY